MFDLIKKNINLRSGIILLSLAIFFVFITNSFKKNKSKDISNYVVQVEKGILSNSIFVGIIFWLELKLPSSCNL